MNEQPKCELCGEPMPEGEEMFKYHGYSGNCPKPPKKDATVKQYRDKVAEIIWREQPTMVGGLDNAYRIADKILAIAPSELPAGQPPTKATNKRALKGNNDG